MVALTGRTNELLLQLARRAIAVAGEQLISRCGLVGAGVGFKRIAGVSTGEPVIKAFVTQKRPRDQLWPFDPVPESFSFREGNVRSDVEEMSALQSPPWLTTFDVTIARFVGNRRRQRPVAGGESGSHFSMPIGT